MPRSYTQIHIHCIFVVKFRQAFIQPAWKIQLHQYITGIVRNHNHKMISINSMPDHLHLLIGLRPDQSLSELMRIVKSDSSEWINKKRFLRAPFRWQEGFGAFSYSRSQVKTVIQYIENQEEHHRKWTFIEEYKAFLDQFEIEYDQRSIFRDPE